MVILASVPHHVEDGLCRFLVFGSGKIVQRSDQLGHLGLIVNDDSTVDTGVLHGGHLDGSHDAKPSHRALESPEEVFVLLSIRVEYSSVRGDDFELEYAVADPALARREP